MAPRTAKALPDLSQYGQLAEYNRKRHFGVTPEPEGKGAERKTGRPLEFVVQKHRASRLHYDFRLEHRGVMLAWAVPKGPSLDPAIKRLAMETEPHLMDYNQFESELAEISAWRRAYAQISAGDQSLFCVLPIRLDSSATNVDERRQQIEPERRPERKRQASREPTEELLDDEPIPLGRQKRPGPTAYRPPHG